MIPMALCFDLEYRIPIFFVEESDSFNQPRKAFGDWLLDWCSVVQFMNFWSYYCDDHPRPLPRTVGQNDSQNRHRTSAGGHTTEVELGRDRGRSRIENVWLV
jgi:hypothetical protein